MENQKSKSASDGFDGWRERMCKVVDMMRLQNFLFAHMQMYKKA